MFSGVLSCVAIEASRLVLLDEAVDVRVHGLEGWEPEVALAHVEELFRGVLSEEGRVLAVSPVAIGAVNDVVGDSFSEAFLMPFEAEVWHPLGDVEVERVVEQVLGVHREWVFGARSQVAVVLAWPWRVVFPFHSWVGMSCGNIRVSWYGAFGTA